MNKEIKSLTLMKDSELDTLETRLETYMQAEHEVALQLHEQKIKCSGEFDQFTLYRINRIRRRNGKERNGGRDSKSQRCPG